MIKRFTFFIFILLLMPMTAGVAETGESKPQRIISLTLGTDEILLSLVDPKRIVAITAYAADPGISNVTHLANQIPNKIAKVGVESIVSYAPDLVLAASYTPADAVKQLQEIGIPVLILTHFSTIQGIEENIRAIGQAVGATEKAEAIIAEMEARLKRVTERIAAIEKRPGLLSYGLEGWTAGSETTFDEIVTRAGGRNLAAEAGLKGHPKISLEGVVDLNPDIIILNAWRPEASDSNQRLLRHPALQTVSAVQNGRVFEVPGKHLVVVSQFIVEGVEEMARLLHPDHFSPALSKP